MIFKFVVELYKDYIHADVLNWIGILNNHQY